ncbi:MAG TPA: DUF6600 domain-containing protein [Acidobacteriaceae bacterium]|jgi:hypothetical protein
MVTAKRFPTFSIRLWQATVLLFALACMVSALRAQGYPQQQTMPPGAPQPGYGDPNQGDPNQPDPPASVVRVSVLQGNVSLQPAGVPDFSAASVNYPLTNGDRIYTDNGALAELEAGQLAVRMGGQTDLSVTAMTDNLLQFGLGQGSVHLRSYSFDPNSTIELDTPNVAITVLDAGDVRVDVAPDGNSTQVTLLYGQARVDGQGFQQVLRPGESLMLTGNGPVYAQEARRQLPDSLDGFSSSRDSQYQTAIAADADYVSPDTVGAADLGSYGDWAPSSDYGPVWYPRGVAADWQPYSYGRWAYVAPWGWTWVGNEPWGFAPFHYGRWARFPTGRWGWIPGPRVVRPVYSPALVVFVGGGSGVTAWFPLGPREPFVPWYRTSTLYVNRVNVTNIYNRNAVEVRNVYNQRNTNIYINNPNRGYINRPLATVAIRQDAFASGRSVRDAGVRVAPDRLDRAPILQHPGVNPTRAIMVPIPPRALPRNIERRPVENRGAQGPGGYRGGNNGQPNGNGRPGGFNQPGPGQPVNNGNDNRRPPFQGQQPQQPNNGGDNRPGGYPRPGQPTTNQPVNPNPGDDRFHQPGQGNRPLPPPQQPTQGIQGQPNSTIPLHAPPDGRQGPPHGNLQTPQGQQPTPQNLPTPRETGRPVDNLAPPQQIRQPPVQPQQPNIPSPRDTGRPVQTTPPEQPVRQFQPPPQRQPEPVHQPQPILPQHQPVTQQPTPERPQFHPLAPPPQPQQQPRPQVQPQQPRPPAPARTDHPHEEKKDDHK